MDRSSPTPGPTGQHPSARRQQADNSDSNNEHRMNQRRAKVCYQCYPSSSTILIYYKPAAIKTARERKLEQEVHQSLFPCYVYLLLIYKMPLILDHGKKATVKVEQMDKMPDRKWMAHTNLVLSDSSGNPEIQMKPQTAQIKAVLHRSFDIGRINMLCDRSYSPLSVYGPEKIAIDALIKAADALGFDGENDIADRLEVCAKLKDDNYVGPLRDYVCLDSLSSIPQIVALINVLSSVLSAYLSVVRQSRRLPRRKFTTIMILRMLQSKILIYSSKKISLRISFREWTHRYFFISNITCTG